MIRDFLYFRDILRGLVVLMVIVLFLAPLGVQGAGRFGNPDSQQSSDVSDESPNAESSMMDDDALERCQRYCLGGPGGSNVMASQVASCLQDCNDKAWTAYDKRMKTLKGE